MPIKKKDWAKILQGLAQMAQIPYQVQQLKEAQARQEEEDELRRIRLENARSNQTAQADAAKAQTDVASLLKMASMQGPVSVPFPGGGGGMEYQPAPEGILSEATNSLLEQAYERAYGKSLPEHLRMQDQSYPSASKMLTERKAQGELGVMGLLESQKPKPPELNEDEKNINAHVKNMLGKPLLPEEQIRIRMHPLPDLPADKQKAVLQKAQEEWDVDVRNWVKVEANSMPKMRKLLLSGQGVLFLKDKPENWSEDDWKDYRVERQAIYNIFGPRPILTGTPQPKPEDIFPNYNSEKPTVDDSLRKKVKLMLPDATDEEIEEAVRNLDANG